MLLRKLNSGIEIDYVRHNDFTGGECCNFYVNGKKYYASVAYLPGRLNGAECKLFEREKNGEIALPCVYSKKCEDASVGFLLQCVRDFTEKQKKQKGIF